MSERALRREKAIMDSEASRQAESERKAKAAWTEAVNLYRERKLEAARDKFEEAYALTPRPEFLISLAQVQTDLGQFAEALTLYERVSGFGSQEIRDRLSAKADLLRAKVGFIVVETNEPACAQKYVCYVFVDGKSRYDVRQGRPAIVMPGQHEVYLSGKGKNGKPQSVSPQAGQTVRLTLAL